MKTQVNLSCKHRNISNYCHSSVTSGEDRLAVWLANRKLGKANEMLEYFLDLPKEVKGASYEVLGHPKTP